MRRRIRHKTSPRAKQAANRMLKTYGADIFAIAAGIGVFATSVCSYYGGKASVLQNDEEPGSAEWFKTQCKILAPTMFATGITIACIGGSRHYGRLREKRLSEACAVLGAYIASRSDSRGKETNGNRRRNGEHDQVVEDTGTGDIIFVETFTGRRFKASLEVYEYAIRKLQDNFSICGFATLNDFYALLGIDETMSGEVLAWTSDQMVLDPYYEPGDDFIYDEALTELAIQLRKIGENEYEIHYNVLPIGSLAGIGPCNY